MPLWLYWILLGLLAGTLAKFLVPGRDPAGCIVTILLGVLGAFVGGLVGTALGWGTVTAGTLNLRSIAIATFGAIMVLLIARLAMRRKN
ncbi:MAG TPA: GlsB/YeaQ/YmgE family stress response membrane protein [Gemmatimonadaceae bacterium]|nr:GlsB/YeaQ/YmgE family stress response membrane protein [Gemmatimonadaceae bacterium]